MKRKIGLTIFVLLLVSAVALCVFAQSQTEAPRDMGRGMEPSAGAPYVVGNGVRTPARPPVTLCTGPVMATDGSTKCLYQALPLLGKLRIKMHDGAVHEIDLTKVKEITVE